MRSDIMYVSHVIESIELIDSYTKGVRGVLRQSNDV